MSKHIREKIALVVFALLVVMAGCCLGGYLVAGHSWNVAASSLDDTFGSMEGYTVIAYEGTIASSDNEDLRHVEGSHGGSDDVRDDVADERDAADGPAAASEDSATGESALGAATAVPAGDADDTGDAPDATVSTDAVIVAPTGGATASLEDETPAASADGAIEASSGEASRDPSSAAKAESEKRFVSVEQVCASYEEKNATVFALDVANLDRYSEGTILKKGSCRFGVFSVDESTRPLQVKRMVDYFEKHEVDFIVAIASDKKLVEDIADGIDIVISIRDEELFVMGEMIDGTFFVDAPERGSVGAILISPSNVVSAKVIDEL